MICPEMERNDLMSWRKAISRPMRLKQIAAPEGQYNVILADPPWKWSPYSDKGMLKSAANEYPLMDGDDIAALPIHQIAAKDAVLFLWVHGGMIDLALNVMAAWKFRYVSEWVWKKSKPGKGYWSRNKHELLLIGTKGKIPAPEEHKRPPSIIEAPTNKHSQKPIVFHQKIENIYPGVPKIELFARRNRQGWDTWGNEAGRY